MARPEIGFIGIFDNYIAVTVKLYNGTKSSGNFATVKRRATNANGILIGSVHNKPPLDTRYYEVDL